MKKLPLKGWGLDHVTSFRILGSLYIYGMIRDRNFVFGAPIEYDMYYPTHNKLTPGQDHVM